MNNMFTLVLETIKKYELYISINEEIIEKRRIELKVTNNDTMKALHKQTIRALEEGNRAYQLMIRDLEEIKEEAYREE